MEDEDIGDEQLAEEEPSMELEEGVEDEGFFGQAMEDGGDGELPGTIDDVRVFLKV